MWHACNMPRWKLKRITVNYAGRDLLMPGAFLEEAEAELTKTYGTETRALVGRSRALPVDNGNASGALTLPITCDYPNADQALIAMAEAQTWADAHTLGELRLTVPGFILKYRAALNELVSKITLCPSGVRLTLTYSFLLS